MTEQQVVALLKIKEAERRVAERNQPRRRAARPQPSGGPGTELKALLSDLGAHPDSNCQCNARAAEMDRWGARGCRERRDEIVAWIKDAAYKTWSLEQVRVGWRMAQEPWCVLTDPVGSLVDEAIRRHEAKGPSLIDTFDRVVLVNLRRRRDRLDCALAELERVKWPFKQPEVFEAVDGKVVPCPTGWKEGGGAWGCRQSHLRVLERALMDDVDHLLVLEDDATFKADFAERVAEFLRAVPVDYDGLCLGGQNHGGITPVTEGVVRVSNCQRTHCYSARPEYQRALYELWARPSTTVHIDWIVGEAQRAYAVYAPHPFLVGQDESKSDISGREVHRNFWTAPKGTAPVVLFHGPREVVDAMKSKGWHRGNELDPTTGIDARLMKMYGSGDLKGMMKWLHMLLWEAASIEDGVVVVWHPLAKMEHLKGLWNGPMHEVEAATAEEAEEKWREACAGT